jgi:hypothetical protein
MFNLTDNELKVAMILVQECLNGMGGSRPSDLEHDEYTWVEPSDLFSYGYSKNEAAGFWSSLNDKGFIALDYDDSPYCCSDYVTTEGWRWLDTVWDVNQHLLESK